MLRIFKGYRNLFATMYKNNCSVSSYSENPADFPLASFYLLIKFLNHATIFIRDVVYNIDPPLKNEKNTDFIIDLFTSDFIRTAFKML